MCVEEDWNEMDQLLVGMKSKYRLEDGCVGALWYPFRFYFWLASS
jgi:hypothetical protein